MMEFDPPDLSTSRPWEPKATSIRHLRRIVTTEIDVGQMPDDDLVALTPYGLAIDDAEEYVASWITWHSGGLTLSFGKFIERSTFDELMPLRTFLQKVPDDAAHLVDLASDAKSVTPASALSSYEVARQVYSLADRWVRGGRPFRTTLRVLESTSATYDTSAVKCLDRVIGWLYESKLNRTRRTILVEVLNTLGDLLSRGES